MHRQNTNPSIILILISETFHSQRWTFISVNINLINNETVVVCSEEEKCSKFIGRLLLTAFYNSLFSFVREQVLANDNFFSMLWE
mgnify:CR=1 FL=1